MVYGNPPPDMVRVPVNPGYQNQTPVKIEVKALLKFIKTDIKLLTYVEILFIRTPRGTRVNLFRIISSNL